MNLAIDHLDDSRCADLVLGLVPAEDRATALDHAARCLTCARRLRHHVSAHERWRIESSAGQSSRATRGFWPWGVAAAAAIVAVLMIPRGTPVLDPHVSSVRLQPPSESVLTREGDGEDPHLSAGLRAYAAGDLVLAEAELEKAEVAGAADQARDLYLAQTRFLRGDAAGALSLLRDLRWESVPLNLQHDAVALYAQALRRCGRPASADSVEQALQRTPEWLPLRP